MHGILVWGVMPVIAKAFPASGAGAPRMNLARWSPINGISRLRSGGGLQLGAVGTDSTGMSVRSLLATISLLVCLVATSGCISNDGTPVFVDFGALEVWSGKGMLMEVSPDQAQCRVIVRDEYLIKRDRWVPCIHVHPRQAG
jgi:hypothetical protein